ncbi:MAG: Fe-S cluster assembly ATPase SufC [Candidatus Niyogibacteria bacterium]|nr:MAG: Fe-S cluster assembly ATPase SufC [Candidatus Niyogibacteria bacterium]
MPRLLEIKNLRVGIESKPILKNINFTLNSGETHVIMGPNGSGKSTLAMSIAGHPDYKIKKGEINFNGKKINGLKPEKRACLGIFLGFQTPPALEGVSFFSLMQAAGEARSIKRKTKNNTDIFGLRDEIGKRFSKIGLADDFIMRAVNDGASGGERKKLELAQMQMLGPRLAVFDEIDTGLDVDALKKIGEEISVFKDKGMAVILITHYQRILRYIKPDKVHIMIDGEIVKSGSADLAERIGESGYSYLKCPI